MCWGHVLGAVLPCLPYYITPCGHTLQVSMQAPFPYQVAPSKRQQLAPAMSSVDAPLASSMPGYPFQRIPNSTINFRAACHMSTEPQLVLKDYAGNWPQISLTDLTQSHTSGIP